MEPHYSALRVKTFRSGIFVFQSGADIAALQPLIDRVEDAQRFKGLGLKRTDMTQSRDLRGLAERGLIEITGKGKLRLCVP